MCIKTIWKCLNVVISASSSPFSADSRVSAGLFIHGVFHFFLGGIFEFTAFFANVCYGFISEFDPLFNVLLL